MMHSPYNKLYAGQVLVNGADTVTGYNAARALYNTGLAVFGHASSKDSVYSKSRIWKKVHYGEFNVESLKNTSSEIQKEESSKGIKPVLLLSQDSAVEYVASHRDELKRYYTFRLPKNNIIERLLDKTLFHSWAINNHILVPQSHIVENDASLNLALKDLNYPIIIKPLVRAQKWDSYFPNTKLIYIEHDKNIEKIPDNIFDLSNKFIVQEWIPGGDEDVYFVLVYINEKKECVSLVGQKLLQWPVLSGSTATCISIDDKLLTDIGVEILRKSGLIGLGSVEFKRHSVTKRYYVIEPTVGRNDYQSYIGPASNINLSLYYVLDCLEYSYLANFCQSNAIWVDEINSLRSLFFSYRNNMFSFRLFSLFRYNICFSAWSLYDPVTLFRLFYRLIITKFKRNTISMGNDKE